MLSDTLQKGLKAYAVGDKVRALRLRKKLRLVELASHTGLSPALLSKIEHGRLFPTLPTLLRIALVFNVGLDYFFIDERKRHVVALVRREDRRRFPERPGARDVSYHFESLDFPAVEKKFHAYLAEFHPISAQDVRAHEHAGAELIYVMTGRLGLRIGAEEHELRVGDSIYFDSIRPHSYRRLGSKPCTAMVVSLP